MAVTKREVTDDKVITTTTIVREEPRHIDYQDLLDCVEIEQDDWHGAPWENCDGYDHEIGPVDFDHPDQTDSCAYVSARNGWSGRIIKHGTSTEDDLDDLYEYYRSRGQSKQVAFEAVAESRRLRMEQLVNWYENGWTYYYVKAEYNGYESRGCGGIDDYDYADTEIRSEEADELADQLEADGFIVTGKPEPFSKEDARRNNCKQRLDWNKQFAVVEGRNLINRSYRKELSKRKNRAVQRAQSL